MDHKLNIRDEADPPTDEIVPVVVERFPYRVTAEEGIFKNGKLYEQGDEIMLDRDTASRFVELGEVEE